MFNNVLSLGTWVSHYNWIISRPTAIGTTIKDTVRTVKWRDSGGYGVVRGRMSYTILCEVYINRDRSSSSDYLCIGKFLGSRPSTPVMKSIKFFHVEFQ